MPSRAFGTWPRCGVGGPRSNSLRRKKEQERERGALDFHSLAVTGGNAGAAGMGYKVFQRDKLGILAF